MTTTERHEASHAAALLLAGMTPAHARSDRPTDTTAGSVYIDWGDEGVTREKARAALIAILAGALMEDGLTAWEWPPDPAAVHPRTANDAKQATTLATYLEFDRVDWSQYLYKAQRLARSPAFRRLVGAIERELKAREYLTGEELDEIAKEAACST